MSNNTEQKEIQKEITAKKSYKIPDIVGASVVKLMEDFEKSQRDAVDSLSDFVIEILHALGIGKHVTVLFDFDNIDNPLHTSIMVSEYIRKEWGAEKVKEFVNDFYEYALNTFASSRMAAEGKIIDSTVIAVNEAVHYVAGTYGFDTVITLHYDNASTDINDYRVRWIIVKK